MARPKESDVSGLDSVSGEDALEAVFDKGPGPVLVAPFEVFREALAIAFVVSRWFATIFKKLHNQKLSNQTKQVVCNVYAQVRLKQPGLSVVSEFRSVSQLTGVSERTVARLKNEVFRGTLKPPKRKRLPLSTGKPPAVTGQTRVQRYDSFTLAALRRKVHQYSIRNEAPTAEKILSDVTSDPDMGLPKLSVRTMRRLLNDIGFAFRKRKRNSALLEREDIIVWRRKYLRTLREMRKQKRRKCPCGATDGATASVAFQ
ncbi:uncharacterized protein LOC144166940 [Haemaphysalis longicornis]